MSNPFIYAELHSENPAAAKTFYGQLFSWRLEDAPKSDGRYTEIAPGEGFPAGLTKSQNGGSHWLTYIKVEDLAASTEKAKRLGARAVKELQEIPGEGRFSVLIDPTGAAFGLWEKAA
jgi:predicted enzyme related to lactoylglutathione lyase